YPAAIEMLKAALVKAPASGWLHWELSQTLQDDGQVDEARAERDQARKDNPRLVAAELSYLAEKERALPGAERIQRLKALRKISPESAQVDWALARAYDEAGLKTEALQAGRAAVASAGGPAARVRLAALYQDHDREAAAAGILATALRAAPNDEALLQEQARLSEVKGEAAAVAHYQRVLQMDASAWWYRLRLAELFQATGNLKSAAQVLRAGRELRPQDAHVCALLADVVREIGRSTEAIPLYRVAIPPAPAP